MRSLFTPSRIIVVIITFSLISFLWTFGLPRQLAEPSSPIIEHPADEIKVHDPIAPAPVAHTSHASIPKTKPTATLHEDRPKESDDHRWDDKTSKAGHTTEKTPVPSPKVSGPAGHDEDGGRWEDKEKSEASGTVSSVVFASASPEPVLELISSANTTTATATSTSSAAPYRHTAARQERSRRNGHCQDLEG
jgi:hypothetical protein